MTQKVYRLDPEADERYRSLDVLFHPRSVAVVGASPHPGNVGNAYVRQLQEFGFRGDIYPVNPKAREIEGLQVYPTIKDIPGIVDYVISCIPARMVLSLVDDCIAKGVRAIHLFTARLSETGLEEKVQLEAEIVRAARRGGIRIIGPNCMGLYCPESGLSFRFCLPKEAGPVGFLSQSGGNTAELVYRGAGRGIRFSKVVSYGNAADLSEIDFLEYFTLDPDTEIIAAYIEGVKDGRRFFEVMKAAAQAKPVIILKAGHTEAGTRSVASHTAALAGTDSVWDALCRQVGAVRVYSIEELADLILAFQFLEPPKGRRTLVMGGGGGARVAFSDICESAGLSVPPLPSEIKQKMKELAPEVWSLIGNPVDASVTGSPKTFYETITRAAGHDEIDLLIANAGMEWILDHPQGRPSLSAMIELYMELPRRYGKPMAVVLGAPDSPETWKREAVIQEQERCVRAGLPVYPIISRAANALSKLISYHERHHSIEG